MNLLETSLTGGLMIIAVIFIRLVGMAKLPKWIFVMMWDIVLLRFLLPFTIPLPVLPAQNVQIVEKPQAVRQEYTPTVMWENTAAEEVPTNRFTPRQDIDAKIPVPTSAVNDTIEDENPTPNTEPEPEKHGFKIPAISLEAVRLAVTVCLMAYFAAAYLIGVRRFRRAVPNDIEYVGDWLYIRGLRKRVKVKTCSDAVSPLTYGLLRPVIILPDDSANYEPQLRYILEHEYAHIRHLDTLKKIAAVLVLCFHWFNPLVWVMFVLYNNDMELWCDESVLKQFGEKSRGAYARTLISMEEMKITSPIMSCLRKNPVEDRIISIMKFKKTGFSSAAIAFVSAATLAVTVVATSIEPVPKKTPGKGVPDNVIVYVDKSDGISGAASKLTDSASLQIAKAQSSMVHVSNIFSNEKIISETCSLNENDAGAVVIDLGRTPTKEDIINLTAQMIYYSEDTCKVYSIEHKAVSGSRVIFPFRAPFSGSYSFGFGNSGESDIDFEEVFAVTSPKLSGKDLFIFDKDVTVTDYDMAAARLQYIVTDGTAGSPTFYDGITEIRDYRQRGNYGSITDSVALNLSADEWAIVCIDFGKEAYDLIDQLEVYVTVLSSNNPELERQSFILKSAIVIAEENKYIYKFKAPDDVTCVFGVINYSGEWMFADECYVEIESDALEGLYHDGTAAFFSDIAIARNDFAELEKVDQSGIFSRYYTRMKYSGKNPEIIITTETLLDDYSSADRYNIVQKRTPVSIYYKYDSIDDRFDFTVGTDGLFYTVDGYTVYDSYKSAGLTVGDIGFDNSRHYRDMKFIFIDVTVSYHKPAYSDLDEITVNNQLYATFLRKRENDRDMQPGVAGCIKQVKADSGECVNYLWGALGDTLSDGEEVHYRLGLFINDYHIAYRDLYLCLPVPMNHLTVNQPKIPCIEIFNEYDTVEIVC